MTNSKLREWKCCAIHTSSAFYWNDFVFVFIDICLYRNRRWVWRKNRSFHKPKVLISMHNQNVSILLRNRNLNQITHSIIYTNIAIMDCLHEHFVCTPLWMAIQINQKKNKQQIKTIDLKKWRKKNKHLYGILSMRATSDWNALKRNGWSIWIGSKLRCALYSLSKINKRESLVELTTPAVSHTVRITNHRIERQCHFIYERQQTHTHTSYHRPNATVLHESKPENNSESIAFIFETKFFRFAESFHGKSFFALGTFAVIPPLCSINFHCVFRCKSVLLFSLSLPLSHTCFTCCLMLLLLLPLLIVVKKQYYTVLLFGCLCNRFIFWTKRSFYAFSVAMHFNSCFFVWCCGL